RQTDKIVARHQFGGYKANIVTYTIAKLVTATAGRVDLDRIWREQTLSPALTAAIAELSVLAQKVITSPPGGRTHVGEWAKRPESRTELRTVAWTVAEPRAPGPGRDDTYATDRALGRAT